MVGGPIFSQALISFTTPVVYFCFDRLSLAARRWLLPGDKLAGAAVEGGQGSPPGGKP